MHAAKHRDNLCRNDLQQTNQSFQVGAAPPSEFMGHNGFTLLEVIIAAALIAFLYVFALPRLDLVTDNDVTTKINRLAGDIRDAFDMAVLTGYPHRMGFDLASGDYWLETTLTKQIYLGAEGVENDPTERDINEKLEEIESQWEDYTDLAGNEVTDHDNDKEIPPTSPVLKAKDAIKPPQWGRVDLSEWKGRTLAPNLIFMDIWAEHHSIKQQLSEIEEGQPVYIYFFPRGFVEKAVIHFAYRSGDRSVDEEREPWTLVTFPTTGHVTVENGYQEIDPRVKEGEGR